MISLLGYPLDDAVSHLHELGYTVDTEEVRSRKGLLQGESRVVRQQQTDKARILLSYSVFYTDSNS